MEPICKTSEAGDDKSSVGGLQDEILGGDRDPEGVLIHADARYVAYVRDLEYMWRWEILRDGEFVQEGCSLSEESAREAVSHVLSFFRRQDVARATPGDNAEEIHALLRGVGTPQPLKPEA
jgi:soluble methane monooxygenase-binding protein MmoD